jgi:hypothetical protein
MQCLEIEIGEQDVRCTENGQSRNPRYQYVHDYLTWVRKCLAITRQGALVSSTGQETAWTLLASIVSL